MKTVLDLSSQEALEYFLQSENYSNIELPKYFDFGPILRFVEKKIGKKSLDDCRKGNPSDCDKVNYKLFVNKNGRYVYRPLQLANPYLYYLLAREITSPDNWEFLKKRTNGDTAYKKGMTGMIITFSDMENTAVKH